MTGSSRGIGRALAIACATRGDRVVVHGGDRARIDASSYLRGYAHVPLQRR